MYQFCGDGLANSQLRLVLLLRVILDPLTCIEPSAGNWKDYQAFHIVGLDFSRRIWVE